MAKEYSDAFEATELESVLAARGIGRFFLAGAQTDECIRSTLHGAITRGYDVTLVADAHTTEDLSEFGAPPPELVVAHTNLYWQNHRAPGRTAGTVNAADVDFAGRLSMILALHDFSALGHVVLHGQLAVAVLLVEFGELAGPVTLRGRRRLGRLRGRGAGGCPAPCAGSCRWGCGGLFRYSGLSS